MAVIQARISAALRPISRPYLQASRFQTQRAAWVTGPRGVGKTSFLLREAQKHGNALYVSADHPLVSSSSLWELGEKAFLSGYTGLIVDEVHFCWATFNFVHFWLSATFKNSQQRSSF